MFKDSVGWAEKSVNPVKGLCQGGCKLPDGREYCYYSGDRGIAKRFGPDPELRLDMSVFDKLPKKPSRIFLQSTNDLFGRWIPVMFRDLIFKRVAELKQHTFITLTKQPHLIDREFSENVWIGTTVDGHNSFRITNLMKVIAGKRIVSFEPLLYNVCKEINLNYILSKLRIDWIIIGRLTRFGHKYDPELSWIKQIVEVARQNQISIFLKDNLRNIWPGELIQELPKGDEK